MRKREIVVLPCKAKKAPQETNVKTKIVPAQSYVLPFFYVASELYVDKGLKLCDNSLRRETEVTYCFRSQAVNFDRAVSQMNFIFGHV